MVWGKSFYLDLYVVRVKINGTGQPSAISLHDYIPSAINQISWQECDYYCYKNNIAALVYQFTIIMKSTLKVHNPRIIILLICMNDVQGKELSY